MCIVSLSSIPSAFSQEIIIEEYTPCFLNYTAGIDLWEQCGADNDFIAFALMPFQWVTGGFLMVFFVTVMIIISYIKYHKIIYPMLIGTLYFPIASYLFPAHFVTFAVILAFVGAAFLLVYMFIRQTKDYN